MRNGSQKVSSALVVLGLASVAIAGQNGQNNKGTEIRVEKETLKTPIRYQLSRSVAPGRVVKVKSGTPGSVVRTYRLLTVGNKRQRELLKEERTEPTESVFVLGRGGFTASRGSYIRGRVMTMEATAYHALVTGTGRTKTGERARYGVVAVDPRVIPLGSMVFVEGYGLALACDTGGAIRGKRIDVCFTNARQIRLFGRRDVKVHVLR